MNWQNRLYQIIFAADTKAGKKFNLFLSISILASILVILLESVESIRTRFSLQLNITELFFTLLFSIEYLLRLLAVKQPLRYALSFPHRSNNKILNQDSVNYSQREELIKPSLQGSKNDDDANDNHGSHRAGQLRNHGARLFFLNGDRFLPGEFPVDYPAFVSDVLEYYLALADGAPLRLISSRSPLYSKL